MDNFLIGLDQLGNNLVFRYRMWLEKSALNILSVMIMAPILSFLASYRKSNHIICMTSHSKTFLLLDIYFRRLLSGKSVKAWESSNQVQWHSLFSRHEVIWHTKAVKEVFRTRKWMQFYMIIQNTKLIMY